MKWTDDQFKAINEVGGKIIVSAAAGSGKTAVLSARIINYILNGGTVDKLLVVTFTTLAAGEMKERIKKNINDELIKNPNNKHLQKQILLIEQALIMTMDAFYSKLIKENYMYLNISPKFEIIDQLEYVIIKKEIARDIVNEELLSNKEITSLLDNFSNSKDGTTIEELLITFNEYINKIPFSNNWLNNLNDIYKVTNFKDSIWSNILHDKLKHDFEYYDSLYKDFLEEIRLDEVLLEKLSDFVLYENNKISELLSLINNKDFDSINDSINKFNFDRLPSIRGYGDHPTSLRFKTIRDELKKSMKYYQSTIFGNIYSNFENDLQELNNLISSLVQIIIKYRERLSQIRLDRNFLSFDDVPHLVLELLIKEFDHYTNEFTLTEQANEISSNFDEILIDEYQDTNLLQNLIFKAISKDNENLFLVGDAKQSIYGFRSARPDLLITEKKNSSLTSFPMLINLSKNFRSRKEVLDITNYVFSKIMSENYGDITYDDSEALNLGAGYPIYNKVEPELYLLTNEDEEVNDELEDLSNQEKEAIFVAQKIKELFDTNYQVFDNSINQFRAIVPSDIAVLLRSPGEFANSLRKFLENVGVNAYTEKSPIYFDNYEVKLVICLLKIINNPYDDISLTSILRSPIFGFSEDELLKIRLVNNNNYLFTNVTQLDDDKIKNFLDKLNDYQLKAMSLNTCELINYIYKDTKIITLFSSLPNGNERIKNLLEMINHANKYDDSGLSKFIEYIDLLIENKSSFEGSNPSSDKDSILITTIHKSKGLEFPVVFLPRLDKKFNLMDLYDEIIMDDDYYIGFKIRNHKEFSVNSNLVIELLKIEKLNKQLSEELRVLYVALTRSKEKLIMSGTIKSIPNKIIKINGLIGNNNVIPLTYLKSTRTILDWLLPLVIKHRNGKELRDISGIDTFLYNDNPSLNLSIINTNELVINDKINDKSNIFNLSDDEINNILDFEYPHQLVKYKQQMSVSDLNDSFKIITKPKFIDQGNQFIAGNIYHKIMEHLEFIVYDESRFNDKINELVNNGVITKEELSKINLSKIFNFFKDQLYNDTIINGNNHKEYPITFLLPLNKINKDINNNDDVIIEGIIDLVCVVNNDCYIIDYKSDIVKGDDDLLNRYKQQLDLYENALNKKGYSNIYKYIYSFNMGKFIKVK